MIEKASVFEDINLAPFFLYFGKNYLNGEKYPIEAWNAYFRVMNDIPLTSNSAEVFNRHFYGKFEQCHPGISTFFDKLKVNQSNIENDIENRMVNATNVPNNKYREKLNSIKTICINYPVYYGTTFVELISKLYNWKFDLIQNLVFMRASPVGESSLLDSGHS